MTKPQRVTVQRVLRRLVTFALLLATTATAQANSKIRAAVKNPNGLNFARLKRATPLDEGRVWGVGAHSSLLRFRGESGETLVLKIYTEDHPTLTERYSAILSHFGSSRMDLMSGVEFQRHGIWLPRDSLVSSHGKWHAGLLMPFRGGKRLDLFVAEHLHAPDVLRQTARELVELRRAYASVRAAHGDLQHGNLRAAPLTVVDFDPTYVPALAHLGPFLLGHQHYVHPQRFTTPVFDETVDWFPALSLYEALRAYAALGPRLRHRLTPHQLLFHPDDYLNPDMRVGVWAELDNCPDRDVRRLARALCACCQLPMSRTPRLEEIVQGDVISERLEKSLGLSQVR
jgi:hypothetical protein